MVYVIITIAAADVEELESFCYKDLVAHMAYGMRYSEVSKEIIVQLFIFCRLRGYI